MRKYNLENKVTNLLVRYLYGSPYVQMDSLICEYHNGTSCCCDNNEIKKKKKKIYKQNIKQ